MKIFQVGSDRLNFSRESRTKRFYWVVYEYTAEGYDGWGDAVFLGKDGLLYTTNLSHCSDDGPLDEVERMDTMTVEDFLRPKYSIHDYDCTEAVRIKVRQLLTAVVKPRP